MQAVAAEDMDMKPRIAKAGAIAPLVTMLKSGTCPSLPCGAPSHLHITGNFKYAKLPLPMDSTSSITVLAVP